MFVMFAVNRLYVIGGPEGARSPNLPLAGRMLSQN